MEFTAGELVMIQIGLESEIRRLEERVSSLDQEGKSYERAKSQLENARTAYAKVTK